MGNRKEWTKEQLEIAVKFSEGNLSDTAKHLNSCYDGREKVSRQNLNTWLDNDYKATVNEITDIIDLSELSRKNLALTKANNTLRREAKRTGEAALNKANVLTSLAQVVSAAEPAWPMPIAPSVTKGRKTTIEILFSDIQIGKLMDDYDSKVAVKRAEEWINVVMKRITNYQSQGFEIENIIFALLGDIIESDKKHPNSGRGCDIGTADQMKIAQEIIFQQVLKRLAMTGAHIDVIMITGNHDHDDHGLNMFYPGREHLSWPMYNAIKMLSNEAGINATFNIPVGSFHIHELYGQKILYEHGVGVNTSEAAMNSHVAKRIRQQKEYIHMFRMGDKHNVCRFNNDRLVVNGAFFGDSRIGEEYSGIVGYDGEPAQVMFAHIQRDDKRSSLFDSLVIQLGHIV